MFGLRETGTLVGCEVSEEESRVCDFWCVCGREVCGGGLAGMSAVAPPEPCWEKSVFNLEVYKLFVDWTAFSVILVGKSRSSWIFSLSLSAT